MNIKIKMAGTSCGGSSYATRILKALILEPSLIEVTVTWGSHQHMVYKEVVKAVDLIEMVILSQTGIDNSLNIVIKKEECPYE